MGAPALLPLGGGAGNQDGAQEQVAQFAPGDGIGEGRRSLPFQAGAFRFQPGQELQGTVQPCGIPR
jgi:hypothetical protein